MKSFVFAALSAALICSACATVAPERDGPSPRAECANETAIIYFEPDTADVSEASARLMGNLVGRMEACAGAGGEIDRIAIVAFPDERVSRDDARGEMQARASVVREALVQLGAPADRITAREYARRTDGERPIMQRRAEIRVEMW